LRSSPHWSRIDAYLIAALWVATFLFAKWYLSTYRAGGGVAQFYQDQFGPAVMQACGRGFVNVDSPSVPVFDDFLKQRTRSLRCFELPATMKPVPLSGFHGSSRYLMAAAALVWRITGVNFEALDLLIAGLFAVAVTAAYAAVRFGCGRIAALIVVLLWTFSYRHLENLPHLRDYSKAPFFMLMLVAMAMAAAERRPRRLIAIGAVFGAVQGLGFGMRTDVALNFVPFLLVLFAASAVDRLASLRARLMCAVVSLGVFVVVALPILQTYARNSSLGHVVLLGLTSPYDENLRIGFPRTAYSFPYAHNDSYIEAVVRAYWSRLHPADPPLKLVTRAYDRACQDYFFKLAVNFPGDLATRAVASIAGIVNLPFWLPDGVVPVGVANPTLKRVWQFRGEVAQWFYGTGLMLIAGVLVVVGLQTPLYACVAFVLLLFWGAFPAIEFQGRHIFQFEFVVLAAIAWAVTRLWHDLVAGLSGGPERKPADHREIRPRLLRAVATVAVLIAVVATAVVGARAYQVPNAREFVSSYDHLAAVPVAPTTTTLDSGAVRLNVDLFHPPGAREEVQEVLLKAEFDFAQCGHPPALNVAFRYEVSERWFSAFSRETALEDLGEAPTRVFLPVYLLVHDSIAVARFAGVEVPSAFARCVRLSRIDDTTALPLVIPVTVAPDWQRKLYQRVRLNSGLGY